MRLSVEHIVEEALEAKVEEILGRGYYERGAGPGYRKGYRQGRLKTSEGRVEYAVPQVRDARGAGELRAFRELVRGRSDELERLAIEMYARGCSTRDIEAIFGPGMLSRSSVSELTEELWSEYEAFATRDLSEIGPLYLFVDGLYERFGEERRRMKAVGTFFGERPVLKLMYAVLIRATENWRGITVTEFEARQLRELYERREQARRQENQTENGSASDRVYSKSGT